MTFTTILFMFSASIFLVDYFFTGESMSNFKKLLLYFQLKIYLHKKIQANKDENDEYKSNTIRK